MGTTRGDIIFGAGFLVVSIGVGLILDASYWPVAVAIAALIIWLAVGTLRAERDADAWVRNLPPVEPLEEVVEDDDEPDY